MLKEAIELQKTAVANLISLLEQKKELIFKAPTGSGKTYMMADLMNKVLEKDNNIIFLVSTLSKGDLAAQNYDKFCEYSANGYFSKLKPYLISSNISSEERLFIPTDYNVYLLPRDLYKKGGRLMQGAMENFLQTLTLNIFFGGFDKKIYLIKDECHIATNNLDSLSNSFFEKIINFSSTPNLKREQYPDVEIKDEDAVNAKLIKHIEFGSENDSVEDAICKFEEIKHEYRNLLGINPCLIIQISNKDKADYELNNRIMPILNKIEHQDLKWMLIVDNPRDCATNDFFKVKKIPINKWKNYAKENTATVDIIIFKMVISEGWDIPRACMLYQVRGTQSEQLDEQVMGRVRRNPKLLTFETLSAQAQKLATTAWIWGVIPSKKRKIFGVKLYDYQSIINEFKLYTTHIKSLTERKDFNIEIFLNSQKNIPAYSSIFDLYNKLNKSDDAIKNMCYDYADSVQKWWKFTENINNIVSESNKFVCNYSLSMEINYDDSGKKQEISFPIFSSYEDNGNYVNISDWVWCRKDGKDKFSFDSEAEREWANILMELTSKNIPNSSIRAVKKILVDKKDNAEKANLFSENELNKLDVSNKFLWGKNYFPNSSIKFEYYLEGIHSSYPDFIMKDCFNRIHIFEIKSLNVSSLLFNSIDSEKYKCKVEELKKCYKQASVLTNHIFYLPILKDETWYITQLINGKERNLTKEQFIDFVLKINKEVA